MFFGTYAGPLLALVAAIVPAQASAVTAAQNTVEVDLIFPLNSTYAPKLPRCATEPLSLSLSWRIIPSEGPYDAVVSSTRDLTWTDFHNGKDAQDPYYIISYAHNKLKGEGKFRFFRGASVANCTVDYDFWGSQNSGFSGFRVTNGTEFTLRSGTQLSTLSSSVGVCPINVLTVNITHTVNTTGRPDIDMIGERDTCGAFSASPPKANPCAAMLDGPTAANITANVTRLACYYRSLTAGCPPLMCQEMAPTVTGSQESNTMVVMVPAFGAGYGWI